uniref:NADH-ubiquinone oxidoreductase chain 4 n=2 Tax=Taenia pisiformis TaxID=85432 RepID=D3YLS7_TAEPI|nr:NADH dehydrogenase subunit 4 [Taenia pisiformis]ADC52489.1 NADH dehydrogenase subunit 4 [Taenia pisiformis]QQY84926.1 NADH dehydrogenase subunit 4 [Taenia pisiformis]
MFLFFSVSWFLVVLTLLLCALFFSLGVNCTSVISNVVYNGFFIFDSISFYLIVLVLFLGLYSQVIFYSMLSNSVRVYLILSLGFTTLSFCINHCIIFWCFYELSMLPLLYLIFKESPYSERFLAGWYFMGYLLSTSLPLVLLLLYFSYINDSFFFSDWVDNVLVYWLVYWVLSFVFFTKVPLVPFHTWLPIVHAEATSIVSIFLSGYIMKLGLLGVYRCTCYIFNSSFLIYLFICCVLCVSFIITSCSELDGKRWLAFLSLSHIVIPFVGFFISDWSTINFSFFYCLGHGLSAGIVFCLLWCFYDISNTRNWVLLKSSINGFLFMIIVIISLLSLCSFPTTIQFFCEVCLVSSSFNLFMYIFFWLFYLFFGGLVPLILCGHLLIRSEWYECVCVNYHNYFYFLIVLSSWCYLGFIFL